ncbi:MAG: hypothetical protein WC582_04100 [Patescibacteria group bacterium]
MRLNKKMIFAFIFFSCSLIIFTPDRVQAVNGLDPNFKQVKTANSPTVYYLDHTRGFKKAYVNAEAFLSYGNKWGDIKIISQADLDKWPEVQLAKEKDNPAVYYLKSGKKVLIESARDFSNLGFKWEDVVNLSKTDLEQYASSTYEDVKLAVYELIDYELVKTKVNSAVYYIKNKIKTPIKSGEDFIKLGFKWDDINVVEEDDLDDLVSGNYEDVGLDVGLEQSQGEAIVSLDPNSPEGGSNLPLATSNNLLAIFDLKSEVGQVKISSLGFNLKGLFSDKILADIYLSYNNKIDLGITPAVNGKDISFNFKDNPVIINPGETKKIYFWADLNDCPACSNYSLQVSMDQASNIVSDSKISGNFPVTGGSFKLVNAIDVLGQAKIEELTVGEASRQAIIGESEQVLGKFKISEISGNEDILIKNLTVKMQGTALPSSLFSLTLKNEKKKIVAQANSIDEDRQVLFELNNYKIAKKSGEIFTLSASLSDGDGRSLDPKLVKANIVGASNNFGLKVSHSSLEENVGIVRKNLGVISNKLVANKKVFTEKTGSIIGIFEIRNGNQEIYIDNLDLSLVKSSGAVNLNKEVYAVDYNTGKVIGQVSGQALSAGKVTMDLADKILKPKNNLILAFVTMMPTESQDGQTYQLVLNKVNHRTADNIFLSNGIDIKGEIFKVALSRISIYPNNDYLGKIYSKGQTKIVVASFYLESSAGDDIEITGLSIDKGSAGSSLVYDNGFANMKVYIGSKSIATVAQPDKSAFSFEGFSYKLRAGKRIEVKVYVDTIKDLKIDKTNLQITGLVARGYSLGMNSEVSGLNTASQVISFAEVKAQIAAVTAGGVKKDKKDNNAASFKITNNGGEALKLDYLTINSSANLFSNGGGYSNLRIVEASNGKTISSKISKPVAGSNKIKLNSYVLEPARELIINIYIDAGAAVSVGSSEVYLSNLEASGKTSKVKAVVSGLPTAEMTVTVTED